MAITVTHKFTSAKGDGADATLIRPSNWNDNHTVSMATSNIIGRLSAGPGVAEEIPATAYMLSLLTNANYAALAAALGLPTTGDARLTFKTTADAGWVFANDGSIGNAASGATTRANADTLALFTHFYNIFTDTACPVQTSSGSATTRATQGTASNAYTNNCRMVLPRALGRAIVIGSATGAAGSGLTARTPGQFAGEEVHQLTSAEVPNHYHAVSINSTGTSSGSGSATTSAVSNDHSHFFSFSGATGAADRSLDHLHSFSGGTGSMNRNNPHTHTYNAGTILGVSQAGAFGSTSPSAQTTGATDINHEHAFSGATAGTDRSIDHLHGFSVSGNTGGISANHTHTVNVNVSGSASVSGSANTSVAVGYSSGATFGDGFHNNMQPWMGLCVMVRL
jgi:hypothetical protein